MPRASSFLPMLSMRLCFPTPYLHSHPAARARRGRMRPLDDHRLPLFSCLCVGCFFGLQPPPVAPVAARSLARRQPCLPVDVLSHSGAVDSISGLPQHRLRQLSSNPPETEKGTHHLTLSH